jgi:hypothetical protein
MQYIRKSNYASFTFELTNSDGSPLDLSNKTARFILKKEKTDEDQTAVLSQEIVNSDTNIVSFQFDATKTAPLIEGQYYAALKIYTETNMNDEVWNDDCKVVRGVFND